MQSLRKSETNSGQKGVKMEETDDQRSHREQQKWTGGMEVFREGWLDFRKEIK